MTASKPKTVNSDLSEAFAARQGTSKPVTKYVKGSHAARVRAEHDERRTELLSLRDVLCAQRDALNDQIEDIGDALTLLSEPATTGAVQNIVKAA